MALQTVDGKYVWYVTCDMCGSELTKKHGSLRKTLRKAGKKGWDVTDETGDICPECQ